MKQKLLQYKNTALSFCKTLLSDPVAVKQLLIVGCSAVVLLLFFLITGYHFFYALLWALLIGTVAFSVLRGNGI